MSPPSGDPQRLVFLLTRTHAVYQGLLASLLREHNLHRHLRPGMGNVLFALFAQNGQSAGELSEKLGVPKSTMTNVIAGMESNGVIESKPDEGDHRIKRLHLTRRGRSLRPRCNRVTEELAAVFAGDLSAPEVERFHQLLDDLLSRLRDAVEQRER